MKSNSDELFALGKQLVSEKLLALDFDLTPYTHRHQRGDWGLVSDEIKAANDLELRRPKQDQSHIQSRYRLPTGTIIRLVTSFELAITCALLDSELQK